MRVGVSSGSWAEKSMTREMREEGKHVPGVQGQVYVHLTRVPDRRHQVSNTARYLYSTHWR